MAAQDKAQWRTVNPYSSVRIELEQNDVVVLSLQKTLPKKKKQVFNQIGITSLGDFRVQKCSYDSCPTRNLTQLVSEWKDELHDFYSVCCVLDISV